jgi:AcrR family transcriptional regulator
MLRTVGHASGISHDAAYKHFKSRDALLAVVATAALDSHTGRAVLELLRELAQEVPQ